MNLQEFADALAADTREHIALVVGRAVAGLQSEFLELRKADADLHRADLEAATAESRRLADEAIASAVSSLRKDLSQFVTAEITLAREAFKRGIQEATTEAVEMLRAEVGSRIDALPGPQQPEKGDPGSLGRDGPTAEDMRPIVAQEIAAAAPTIIARFVEALPPSQPGPPGRDGPTADEMRRVIIEELGRTAPDMLRGLVDALPPPAPPEKGDPGKDGKDGVATVEEIRGLIDLVVAHTLEGIDQRVLAELEAKAHLMIATLPALIYKGVWREGVSYQPGNTVTWGGNVYHCNKETTEKPDSHFGTGQPGDWTLMVKRGDRGKDGKAPERRP